MRQILLVCFLVNTGLLLAQAPIPVILDTDIGNGIDPEFALALALQSPEINVRAVTVVGDDLENRMRMAVHDQAITLILNTLLYSSAKMTFITTAADQYCVGDEG